MSYVIATPEALAAAVTDIAGIGSSLSAANAAAAVPTTEILAAAADEISTAVASLFGAHALDYQSLSARVASFQTQFMDSLFAGAQRYAGAELLNGSLLRDVAERLLGGGRPGSDGSSAGSASAEATGAATSQPTGVTAKTTAAAATATATQASGGATGTGIKATYATTSQWNSGFVANYTITNTGTTPLTNWQLQFSLPTGESVANLWNGHVTQSGTQYTVTPQSYNTTIAPGDSVTVGFQGAQSGTYSPPTNVSIGGQPVIGGPTPPVTTPPVTTPPAGTGGLTAAYTATSQWNSGFNGNYAITNSGTTPLSNWNLQFDLPANESITNLWNGQVTHTGSHYTVTPASYNGSIAPGSTVNVGFQASQTGSYAAPTNVLINGQAASRAARPRHRLPRPRRPPRRPPHRRPAAPSSPTSTGPPRSATPMSCRTTRGTTRADRRSPSARPASPSPLKTVLPRPTAPRWVTRPSTRAGTTARVHRARSCRYSWARFRRRPAASATPIQPAGSTTPPTTSG